MQLHDCLGPICFPPCSCLPTPWLRTGGGAWISFEPSRLLRAKARLVAVRSRGRAAPTRKLALPMPGEHIAVRDPGRAAEGERASGRRHRAAGRLRSGPAGGCHDAGHSPAAFERQRWNAGQGPAAGAGSRCIGNGRTSRREPGTAPGSRRQYRPRRLWSVTIPTHGGYHQWDIEIHAHPKRPGAEPIPTRSRTSSV